MPSEPKPAAPPAKPAPKPIARFATKTKAQAFADSIGGTVKSARDKKGHRYAVYA
jgi:hypothetical protein